MPRRSRETPFDSIYALSSPQGLGERGVVRISGARAFEVASRLVGGPLPRERAALRRRLLLSGNPRGPVLPAMLLCFPGPASFTGEDVVELHTLSSPSILALLGERLVELGLRRAWPGEFSRRAFTNHKIDLSQAEAIMALIRARDGREMTLAGAAMREGAGAASLRLREGLLDLLGLLEAGMDFEEGETGGVEPGEWVPLLEELRRRLRSIEPGSNLLEERFSLPSILVVGPPNAGKTSLCNALADPGERMALGLVADLEGTTRDVRWLVCGGGAYRLGDSPGRVPGLEEGEDLAEDEGLAQEGRILERELRVSDAWIWVSPRNRPIPPPRIYGAPLCWVLTKADLGPPPDPQASHSSGALLLSVREGKGLEALEERLKGVGRSQAFEEEWSALLGGRLVAAGEALDRALALAREDLPVEMVASELQEAIACLQPEAEGSIPEELLDRIFSSFCLGK